MAEYSLTLSALKYANVTNFSRPFGTKKTSLQNAGSLTTEEFNIVNALPFDIQRPLVITETSTVSNIQYDANLVINSAGKNITLNTAQYIGAKVSVYAQTAGNVIHDSVTDALLAGERVVYEWNGTGWDCVGGTPLGKLNYTSMCTSALSASKAVSISGFTLKDGVTVEVFFVNGHYVSLSSDAFTLNINALGAKKIYACKDGSQILMPNHSIERSESGDSQAHNWYIQPNTTLKLMYLSSLDSNNGGFVIIGNPIVLSSADYVIYADGYYKYKKFSDKELWTGKFWSDGKPIYNKEFTGTVGPGQSGNLGTLTDEDTICNIDGVYIQADGSVGPFWNASNQWKATVIFFASINQVVGEVGSSMTTCTFYASVEYTKTTDTAGTIPPFVAP